MPNLTYIGQTPADGTGSPVIVLRHLRRLAANGWKITIIPEDGQDTSLCAAAGWKIKRLPLRRAWWPPFRHDHSLSRRLRTWLLGRECLQLTREEPPDAIFGYLAAHADFSAEIAAHFSRQARIPLSLLVHDDASAFAKTTAEKRALSHLHSRILRQCHRCWFVSPELAAVYQVQNDKRHVLLPIPEGWTPPVPPTPNLAHPKIYYAGHIWAPQYPLLAEIARTLEQAGAKLVLICKDSPELQAFLTQSPVEWLPLFPTNREALSHLKQHAAGLLVAYTRTIEEMPWIATSYPSKFIEYAHLHLPCAIVAPAESCIGHWAQQRAFADFFTPEQLPSLATWAASLRQPHARELATQRMQALALGEFSPERIQETLENQLLN
jgi:hypothetical protein